MKVCFYLDSEEIGGTEQVLGAIIAALPEHFDVTVLGVSKTVLGSVTAARPGCRTVRVPNVRSKVHLHQIRPHIDAMRSIAPDVVHVSHPQLWQGQYGLLTAHLLGVPAVSVVHCVLPPAYRLQPFVFRYLLSRCAVVAGVSEAVCRDVESSLRLTSGQVQLVHNGVPDAAVTPTRERETGSFTVGAVGRMTHEKGFDVLLRALPELPAVDLVLIGDGVSRPSLEGLAVELGVADRITWVGWTSELWTTRWNVDLLAVPSRVEGFGLVAVEAMLAGIPVVAARVGGLPEVVRDGDTGVLVPADDPLALASAIRALKADPIRLARMGRASVKSARERFSVESMVRGHEAMLERAAGSCAQPGGLRRLMSRTAPAAGR